MLTSGEATGFGDVGSSKPVAGVHKYVPGSIHDPVSVQSTTFSPGSIPALSHAAPNLVIKQEVIT